MTTQRPRAHERGASAVEYALLAAAVAAVIVTAVVLLGGHVTKLLDETCDDLRSRADNSNCD